MIKRTSQSASFGLKAALSLGVGLTALSVGISPVASAQEDSAEDTKRLNTITVSSTKREQTLQDVPVAVSVVGEEVIEKAEIQDLNDLQSLVPSLTVRQSQTSANTTFFIRGFGNGSNAIGIEPSVGIFIDGVYRSRGASAISDLPNLQRVEVLRGPQSTLFGKNASAGVISVVTRKPQFEFGGNIEASLGNYNSRRVKGDITGPITDTLAFSLSGSFNQRDGYADDLATGEDYNQRDRWGLRGELLFKPIEALELRLIADVDEIDEICCVGANLIDGPTGNAVRALGGQLVGADPFSYEVFSNFAPFNEIENSGVSLQADYDLGFATLTSITSSRDTENTSDVDGDFTSLDIIGSNFNNTSIETFTQELRLTSSAPDSRIDWMVGGYYFDETVDVRNSFEYGADYRNYLGVLAGNPAAVAGLETLGGLPPNSLAQAGQGLNETIGQDNTAWSLFGTLDFHITDRLTATIGLNYTDDEKDASLNIVSTDALSALNLDQIGYNATLFQLLAQNMVDITNPASIGAFVQGNPAAYAQLQQVALGVAQSSNNPFNGLRPLQFLPPVVGFPNAVEDGRSQDSDTTYTLRLAYDVTDNINVYGSYATGFKATSWNLSRFSKPFASDFVPGNPISDPITMQPLFVRPSSAITNAGLATPNLTSGTRLAGPEEAEVYELGIKGSFENFAFNLAIFDQTIEGFQTNTFTGTGFSLANAGEQSSTGIEVDATWNPTDQLTLTFAGTFLDPEYDSFTGSAAGDISGQAPEGISDTLTTLGANYDFQLASFDAFIRADWQYASDSPFRDDPAQDAAIRVGGYSREQNLINASAGITTPNGINVSVWGRNIFEDEHIISAFPSTGQAGSFSGYPNQPQTYGVTVRKRF